MRPAVAALAERLRRLREPLRAGSPRIAVMGNCQGSAVAAAMRLLLPEAEVTYVPVYRIARRYPRMADLVRDLARHDHVFAGAFTAPFRDGGDFETLRAAVPLIQIPTIVFSAFQPDIVYVGQADAVGSGFLRGPVGNYHSALALYAFRRGFDVERTLALFRPDVYGLLGYYDLWDASAATLLGLGRDAGYDLAQDLGRWMRRGPFMHLVNHPRMFVANDLARGLLRKAGLAFADCDLDTYAADEIARLGSWPVYPPVAERLGLSGSYAFLAPATRRTPPATLGLARFVAASHDVYRACRPAELACERVEIMLAQDEVGAALSA